MSTEDIMEAFKGSSVSRRSFLSSTVNVAAGVIAASALGASAKAISSSSEIVRKAPHADQPAAYVHALHGWDTI